MKKIISIFIVCIIMLVGCNGDSDSHEGEVKTPSGSSIQEGRDYQEVVDNFKEKGFKNIKTEKLEDLITGWLTKDGEVEEVSVGGDVDYSPDEWVSADTEVIIKYHTFKTEETASVTESEEQDNSSAEKSEEETLTVDNNKEFAEILSIKDESSPLFKEFAQKYAGRTIEFDGNTAYVNNHGNYKTRFDYLIFAGDYSETTFSGPNFQFRDVNYTDLHLTGDNVPNTLGVGLNIRIIAKIEEYNENSGLFQLKPVSIQLR